MSREHLDHIVEEAARHGVLLEAEEHGDHLWLGRIERSGARRGMGAAVLQELLDWSEEWDLPVRCAVESSADRLIDWYVTMGFEIETMADLEGGRPQHAILFRNPEGVPTHATLLQLQEA